MQRTLSIHSGMLIWDLTHGIGGEQQIIYFSPLFNDSEMQHTLM